VDAKVPLDAYLDAAATELPAALEQALDAHVGQVRAKVRELAGKATGAGSRARRRWS